MKMPFHPCQSVVCIMFKIKLLYLCVGMLLAPSVIFPISAPICYLKYCGFIIILLLYSTWVSGYSGPLFSYISHILSRNQVFKFISHTHIEILIRITLSLWSILGSLSIYIILDHSLYKHYTYFHLLRPSLTFSSKVLHFFLQFFFSFTLRRCRVFDGIFLKLHFATYSFRSLEWQ